MTQVNVVETEIKPLTCKTSDTEYVSEGIDKKTLEDVVQGLLKNLYHRSPTDTRVLLKVKIVEP